ncbi:MAG: hypothetical protein GY862_03675, partial [Gammaproteobacteria bacterium]|nr:hypothetical protein [Gammaproteobacteria bacterium]
MALSRGVTAIAAGAYHTCALTTSGGVKCWGYNGYGQLGDDSTTDRTTPMDVVALSSGVAAIAAGDSHTCVLITDGGVKCWGYNSDGQLGDGTDMNHITPVTSLLYPGTVQFSADTYSVNESTDTVTLNVTRTNGNNGAATVEVSATSPGNTATAGVDFIFNEPTILKWIDGDAGSKTVSVEIVDDSARAYPDEVVYFSLGSASIATLGNPSATKLTIVDEEDEPPALQFDATIYSVDESENASITVTLIGSIENTVSVQYSTSGTATAGSDYSPASGELNFAGEETSKTIPLTIIDDSLWDNGDETVLLTLHSPAGGASLGSLDTKMITIVDNETQPVLEFDTAGYSMNESDGTANITVIRTGGSENAVSVQYSTSGTAAADSDYSPASGDLNFAGGETSKAIPITIIDDITRDNDTEIVTLTLHSPAGGAILGSQTTKNLTISDNDRSLVITKEGTATGTVIDLVTSDDGISCGEDCKGTYLTDSVINLTAFPDDGFLFTGWGGDCAASGTATGASLLVNNDMECLAQFDKPSQALTISNSVGGGQGTVSAAPDALQDGINCDLVLTDCTGKFIQGAKVALTATPASDSALFGWSGSTPACTGTALYIQEVLMNSNHQCNARFEIARQVTITLDPEGTGSGRVTSSPAGLHGGIDCGSTCSDSYPQGHTVRLIAITDSGSVFAGWSGDCSGDVPSLDLTLENTDIQCGIRFNAETKAFTQLISELDRSAILPYKTVNVSGQLVNKTSADIPLERMAIQLYISHKDGAELPLKTTYTSDTGHFGFSTLSGFTQEGIYSIRAEFAGTDRMQAGKSVPMLLGVGQSPGYALLVQGKIHSGEGIPAHNTTLNRIYARLKDRGFDDRQIAYLNYDASQTGVDMLPSLDNIETALFSQDGLLQQMADVPAPLYLILINHGGRDGIFHLGDEALTATSMDLGDRRTSALDDMMDRVESRLWQNNLKALDKPRILMLGYCYSGAFIPALSRQGRIIISSAAADEESYKGPLESGQEGEPAERVRSGEFFMEELFHHLWRGDFLHNAFVKATARTEQYTHRGGLSASSPASVYRDQAVQHPLLDDNGDGWGSNVLSAGTGDGQIAAALRLGMGLDYLTNPSGRVEILEVT